MSSQHRIKLKATPSHADNPTSLALNRTKRDRKRPSSESDSDDSFESELSVEAISSAAESVSDEDVSYKRQQRKRTKTTRKVKTLVPLLSQELKASPTLSVSLEGAQSQLNQLYPRIQFQQDQESFHIGNVGRQHVFETLARTVGGPRVALPLLSSQCGFQREDMDWTRRVSSIFPLLDRHSLTRHQIHLTLLSELTEILFEKQKQLTPVQMSMSRQFQSLMARCWYWRQVEGAKKIMVTCLERMGDQSPVMWWLLCAESATGLAVDPSYLTEKVETSQDIYSVVSLDVRRRIWSRTGEWGLDLYRKLTLSFMKQMILSAYHDPTMMKSKCLILAKSVGQETNLYSILLAHCHAMFLTHPASLSSLVWQQTLCHFRHQIIMTVHQLQYLPIMQQDPCHRLAWCLDALLQDPDDETSLLQLKEMQKYFDQHEKELQSERVVDMAMCLAAARESLCRVLVRRLVKMRHHPSEEESRYMEWAMDRHVIWLATAITLSFRVQEMKTTLKYRVPRASIHLSAVFQLIFSKNKSSSSTSHALALLVGKDAMLRYLIWYLIEYDLERNEDETLLFLLSTMSLLEVTVLEYPIITQLCKKLPVQHESLALFFAWMEHIAMPYFKIAQDSQKWYENVQDLLERFKSLLSVEQFGMMKEWMDRARTVG